MPKADADLSEVEAAKANFSAEAEAAARAFHDVHVAAVAKGECPETVNTEDGAAALTWLGAIRLQENDQ